MKYGKDDCCGKGKPEGTILTRHWLIIKPNRPNRHERRRMMKLGIPPEADK